MRDAAVFSHWSRSGNTAAEAGRVTARRERVRKHHWQSAMLQHVGVLEPRSRACSARSQRKFPFSGNQGVSLQIPQEAMNEALLDPEVVHRKLGLGKNFCYSGPHVWQGVETTVIKARRGSGVACPGNRCARPTLVDPAWPVDPCPNNTCCPGMHLGACLDNRSHVPNNRG